MLGVYEDGRLLVIQDHRAPGLIGGGVGRRESLYYYLSYIASINIFLLLFLLFLDLVYGCG